MLNLPWFQWQYQLPKKMKGRPMLGNVVKSPLEIDPTQGKRGGAMGLHLV